MLVDQSYSKHKHEAVLHQRSAVWKVQTMAKYTQYKEENKKLENRIRSTNATLQQKKKATGNSLRHRMKQTRARLREHRENQLATENKMLLDRLYATKSTVKQLRHGPIQSRQRKASKRTDVLPSMGNLKGIVTHGEHKQENIMTKSMRDSACESMNQNSSKQLLIKPTNTVSNKCPSNQYRIYHGAKRINNRSCIVSMFETVVDDTKFEPGLHGKGAYEYVGSRITVQVYDTDTSTTITSIVSAVYLESVLEPDVWQNVVQNSAATDHAILCQILLDRLRFFLKNGQEHIAFVPHEQDTSVLRQTTLLAEKRSMAWKTGKVLVHDHTKSAAVRRAHSELFPISVHAAKAQAHQDELRFATLWSDSKQKWGKQKMRRLMGLDPVPLVHKEEKTTANKIEISAPTVNTMLPEPQLGISRRPVLDQAGGNPQLGDTRIKASVASCSTRGQQHEQYVKCEQEVIQHAEIHTLLLSVDIDGKNSFKHATQNASDGRTSQQVGDSSGAICDNEVTYLKRETKGNMLLTTCDSNFQQICTQGDRKSDHEVNQLKQYHSEIGHEAKFAAFDTYKEYPGTIHMRHGGNEFAAEVIAVTGYRTRLFVHFKSAIPKEWFGGRQSICCNVILGKNVSLRLCLLVTKSNGWNSETIECLEYLLVDFIQRCWPTIQ